MPEGGTHYDLSLGLRTGDGKAQLASLRAELRGAAQAADSAATANSRNSAALGQQASAASGAAAATLRSRDALNRHTSAANSAATSSAAVAASGSRAGAVFAALRTRVASLTSSVTAGAKSLWSWASTADLGTAASNRFGGSLLSMKSILATLGIAALIGGIGSAVIATERFDSTMRAATGSAAASTREMGFVRAEVQRLGLDLESSAGSYAKWAAAGLRAGLSGQQVRDVFTGVSEASRAMGLGAEEAKGALLAIQQMASKGRVSMEELSGQLGERFPGAVQLAAAAMGVTTSKLFKMAEQGELMARDLLPKLAVELHKAFGDDAQRAAQGLQAQLARLGTAWFDLRARAGEGGTGVTTAIGKIAGALQSLANNWHALESAVNTVLANAVGWVGKFVHAVHVSAEAISDLYIGFLKVFQNPELSRRAEANAAVSRASRAEMALFFSELEAGLRIKAADALDRQAEALKGVAAASGEAGDATKELTSEEARKLKKGQETIAELEAQLSAQVGLTAAAMRGAAAFETAKRRVDADTAARHASKDMLASQKKEVEDLTRALLAEQRATEMASRDEELQRETLALEDLIGAYQQGPMAVAALTAAQDKQAEMHRLLTDLTEEERKQLEPLVRKLLEYRAAADASKMLEALQRQTHEMRVLGSVRRDDFRSVREWEAAIRQATNALEEQAAVEEAKSLGADPARIEQIRAEIQAQQELREEQLFSEATAQTATEKWLGFADALDSSLSGVGDQFQEIVSGLSDMIRGIVEATEAADSFGQAKGWAMALSAAHAIAEATGLLDQNVTQGGFGGSGEGNRSAEGAQIGAVVGAVIGGIIAAYFTMGTGAAAGAQIGAGIGSAAGGIIGSFVKKGADEAIARINLDSGELATLITKSEGGLGSVLREIGMRVNETILDLLDLLGGTMDSIPPISMKVRDGIISVWVGAVVSRVATMDEAITFAVTEILKQADIAGLSETIRTVLQNTQAIDLDQLARDLEFGRWYERLGLDQAAIAIEDAFAEFRTRFRQATELGLDTAPVGAWLGRQLQQMRDQLLGIQVDPKEELRRNVEAFNQQIRLTEAEQLARRADLLVKRTMLMAEIELLRAEMQLGGAHLDIRRAMVEGEGAIVAAELEILNGLYAALAAVDAALASVDLILANLPKPITDEEREEAERRLRRAGGGNRAQERETLRGTLRDMTEAVLPDFDRQLLALGRQFADLAEQARKLGVSEAEVAAARAAQLEVLGRGVREGTQDYLGPRWQMGDLERQEADIRAEEAERRRQNDLLRQAGGPAMPRWQLDLVEDRRLQEMAEEVIDSFGDPMEELRDRARGMGEAINFLRRQMDDGIISAERFGEGFAMLQAQAEDELLGLAAGILEQMGMTEEAAALRAALEEANFHLQVLQLNFLYEQYLALGLISDELKARLDGILGIINNPANWPDFGPVPGAGGVRDDSARLQAIQARKDAADRAREEAEKLALKRAEDDAARRQEILDLQRDWLDLASPDALNRMRELTETFESMLPDVARLGLSVQDFSDAFVGAMQRILDEALAPLLELEERITGGELASLSPEEALGFSRRQAEKAAGEALSSPLDEEAIRRFADSAAAYIRQAEEFYGGGPAVERIRRAMLATSGQIRAGSAAAVPLPPGVAAPSAGLGSGGGGATEAALVRLVAALEAQQAQGGDGAGTGAEETARLVRRLLEGQAVEAGERRRLTAALERLVALLEGQAA